MKKILITPRSFKQSGEESSKLLKQNGFQLVRMKPTGGVDMEANKDCMYCVEDERLENLMIEICKLDISTVYLFKEQTYRGRCNVVFNSHIKEMFNLNKEELSVFINDVSRVANAINKVFKPDKINYGAYGDKMPHLHIHIVPKYEDKENWGSTFEMNPGKTYLSDDEYSEMVNTIKSNLLI